MTYRPNVSIIVPVYNSQKTLRDCVDSLLSLSYPVDKLEIILVNNASTDKTQKILDGYNGRIKVLHEPKKGPAAARNKGLRNATGDVVAFTDADCVVAKNWVQKIVEPLREKKVGVVGGKILARPPANKVEKYGEKIHDHEQAITGYTLPYAITMNWASRLSLLKESGLFNEYLRRCEDSDLSRRIYQAGYQFVYEDNAIIYHRNERTWLGLFREGYLHGFGSIKLNKKYSAFLKNFGHRRFCARTYREIFSNFKASIFGPQRHDSFCFAVFNSGKKLGKMIGSLRYRYFEV